MLTDTCSDDTLRNEFLCVSFLEEFELLKMEFDVFHQILKVSVISSNILFAIFADFSVSKTDSHYPYISVLHVFHESLMFCSSLFFFLSVP